jgi:signal transduction histidine kinase
MILTPYSRRAWTDEDRDTMETISIHLAQRITQLKANAGRDVAAGAVPGEAAAQIQSLENEVAELRQRLHERSAQVSAAEAGQLEALESQNQQAQARIQSMESELDRLQVEARASEDMIPPEEVERLAAELQLALQELADARARLAASETEIDRETWASPGRVPDVEAIAAIAQDLRNPMSSILGYTDLLLGESVGLLGAMQRKFLERVRSGIERMGVLLNNLIQFTALETGTLSLTPGPVDLLEAIEEAVTQASASLREKNLALRMDFPDTVPPLLGDEDAITQIAYHLLNNAVAVTPDNDEIVLAARVQQAEGARFLMLSISDAGEGIPADELTRVFQRSHRADSVVVQGTGGDTVGLSMVKTLIETMGGRVWVDSEVDVGSTFTVLMPLAEQETPVAEVVEKVA